MIIASIACRRACEPGPFGRGGVGGSSRARLCTGRPIEAQALPIDEDRLAVDHTRAHRQGSHGRGNLRETGSEIISVPGEQPDAVALAPGYDPKAIMFDFVYPADACRRWRRKAATFDAGRASPMTWLIAIARNRCIDRLRTTRQSRRMEPIDAADNVMDAAQPADRALERNEVTARLQDCLDTLAERERGALRGAFFDGNTYEEMAARMSVPLGTMKTWIRRAMIKLKSSLGQ